MTTPPTILAVKQAFLEQETRRLALPLVPSRAWQRANGERRSSRQAPDNDGDRPGGGANPRPLPEKAVDDALFRANQLLRQHVRRVYAPQAVRHVAEQLDQLYWQAGERAVPDETEAAEEAQGDAGPLDIGADLTTPAIIAALPPAWEDADVGTGAADAKAEAEAMPLEARRYAELVVQLQDLSARQQATVARVRRLRRLAAMVEPFRGDENEDEDTSLQDSVVTRNGPVERELERMRLLLARVSDRVAALQREDGAGAGAESSSAMQVDDDVEAAGQRRVQALLEQF